MAKATKLIALLAGQAVGAAAAIAIGLLDPAMDRGRARLELTGQIPLWDSVTICSLNSAWYGSEP
jgi:hypothetical protein